MANGAQRGWVCKIYPAVAFSKIEGLRNLAASRENWRIPAILEEDSGKFAGLSKMSEIREESRKNEILSKLEGSSVGMPARVGDFSKIGKL